jgi:CheY-like chemotaxis protein
LLTIKTSAAAGKLEKKKIILVEDDTDILLTVTMMLEDAGYEVIPLTSAASIMDGTSGIPDVYILDKRMPDMDGLDVCRYLKQNPETKHLPVIIISASPKFGTPALKAGANDFLAKPFTMAALLRMVGKYTGDGNSKQ